MKIQLNGKEVETSAANVTELLKESEMAGKPVVVEYNQAALVASAHVETELQDGDQVEVFVLGAGG